MKKKLIIHGHFYQPPRENPWTGEIERQNGAEPYHDFNEKIAAECYSPNAFSKYLDGYGRILDIINNYEYLSFNFGPTLLKWIEKKLPFTYNRIINADKLSCKRFNGHGNAVAQVYNHVIMPLSSREDKLTQITWGIDAFKYHFGRDPEGMWLGETAINMETVSCLIEKGIKFTICSPFQAQSFRKKEEEWIDCNDGSIPTGRPYRIYIEDKFLDVFFFDRHISTAISFEHLLNNADSFRERLSGCYAQNSDLVNIATDGETFGHHEPFANMAITALIKKCHESDMEFVNYSYYLSENTPEFEVKLKKGDYGTAWSCSHGVGRWYRDCGCSTDSMQGWDQKWRTPLRDAFNYLRTECDSFCMDILKINQQTLCELRDKYIDVMNNKIDIDILKNKSSIKADTDIFLKIMEIQKYAQYTFTSCAWFFADISRLEPVQNMKYALKTIDIIRSINKNRSDEIESGVRLILSQGKSNIEGISDGRWIWDNYAKASLIDNEYFVLYAASLYILSEQTVFELYNAEMSIIENSVNKINNNYCSFDIKVEFENIISQYFVFCDHSNSRLKIYYSKEKIDISVLKNEYSYDNIVNVTALKPLDINSLFSDEKENIKERLLQEKYFELLDDYNKIYSDNEDIIEYLIQSGMEIPVFLKIPASIYLENSIMKLIKKYMKNQQQEDLNNIFLISDKLKKLGLKINNKEIFKIISDNIIFSVNELEKSVSIISLKKLISIIEMNNRIQVYINVDHDKNIVFELLKRYCDDIKKRKSEHDFEGFDFEIVFLTLKLAELLNINIDRFREKLNPFRNS